MIDQQLFAARIKANEFIQGYLKQLIAIASAAIVLSVTFVSEVFGPNADVSCKPLLYLSWAFLGLSVLIGVIALALLVNNLDVPDQSVGRSGLSKAFAAGTRRDVTLASAASIVFFLLGLVAMTIFAAINMSGASASQQPSISSLLESLDSNVRAILARLEAPQRDDPELSPLLGDAELSHLRESLQLAATQVARPLERAALSHEAAAKDVAEFRSEFRGHVSEQTRQLQEATQQLLRIASGLESIEPTSIRTRPETMTCESKSWGFGAMRLACEGGPN
jgi:hypothetical protein